MTNTNQEKQNLIKIFELLPKSMANKLLDKQFKKRTRILNRLPSTDQEKKIKKLQGENTKHIKFKDKTAFDWLEELKTITKKPNQQQKEFIDWYQKIYPQLSIQYILNQ